MNNESLISIQVISGDEQPSLDGISWLRLTLFSGRKLELCPKEFLTAGERYPDIGLALKQVETFSPSHQWPDGPELPWVELQAAAPLLMNPLRSIETIKDTNTSAITKVVIATFSAGSIHIYPSTQYPETLRVEVVSATAT